MFPTLFIVSITVGSVCNRNHDTNSVACLGVSVRRMPVRLYFIILFPLHPSLPPPSLFSVFIFNEKH